MAIIRHDRAMSSEVNTDIKYNHVVMWVYPQRYQGGSHEDKYENVPIILAYNWTPSPAIIIRSSPLRRDFLHGVPKLTNLVYHIGELYLGANVTIARPESTHPTVYSSQSFYTYCPDHTPFEDQYQGTCQVIATSVEQYFNVFDQL